MHTSHLVVAGVSLGLALSAQGDFNGFTAEYITLPNGHVVQNILANFTNPTDRLLNIYNTNITTTHPGGFYHSSDNPHWRPHSMQHRATSDDSWVTIGTNPDGSGRANGLTTGDPNFWNFDDGSGATDFSYVHNLGQGAGWYYIPPSMGYGDAGSALQVLVAHFVWTAEPGGWVSTTGWNVSVLIQINGETMSTNSSDAFDYTHTPAPGGMALLALAACRGTRRRSSTPRTGL